jgi:hypothetical protein
MGIGVSMLIKFIYSSSFIGPHYSMTVDDVNYDLVGNIDPKDIAIAILEEKYNISIDKEQIIFEWDGTM